MWDVFGHSHWFYISQIYFMKHIKTTKNLQKITFIFNNQFLVSAMNGLSNVACVEIDEFRFLEQADILC